MLEGGHKMRTVMKENEEGGCRIYITRRARSIAAKRFAKRGLAVAEVYVTAEKIPSPYKHEMVDHELGLFYGTAVHEVPVPAPAFAPKFGVEVRYF